MKIMVLGHQERTQTGFTHKINVLFSDLTAAATTQTLSIFPKASTSMAALTAVEKAAIRLKTPFTGGAISAMAGDLGDGASVARYIANANTDLFTAVATNTKPHVYSNTGYIYSEKNVSDGNNILQLKFTATSANVNAATAGELEVLVRVNEYADFVRPNANP